MIRNRRFSSPLAIIATCLVLPSIMPTLSLSGAVQSEVGKAFHQFDPTMISQRNTKAIVGAANQFLQTLDELLLPKAHLPFNTAEKSVWSNLPPNLDYAGVRIADLSPSELESLMRLLATSLSPAGFEKVRGIMLGDDLLVRGDQTGNRMLFGADNYWFFIFGTPSTETPWGWQFDGHHLALNLTLYGDSMTLAPSFIGTQPAEVAWGDRYRHQPMGLEVSRAFELMDSLSAEQKTTAVVGDRRQNLDAGPGNDGVTPPERGIAGTDLTESQRQQLGELIRTWLEILPRPHAQARMQDIAPTLPRTHFGWWGKTEKESPVYFRIQGPKVLIEFAHQNLGGNPRQHLHSVFRDPTNDYGIGVRHP